MLISNISRTNTILYCRCWEPCVRFYRDVLRLSINYKTDWMVEFHLSGETYLSIANAAKTSIQSAEGNGITLSWQVDDVDCIHNRLTELGIEASEIKHIWGNRAFYFFDPEGHRIELWS